MREKITVIAISLVVVLALAFTVMRSAKTSDPAAMSTADAKTARIAKAAAAAKNAPPLPVREAAASKVELTAEERAYLVKSRELIKGTGVVLSVRQEQNVRTYFMDDIIWRATGSTDKEKAAKLIAAAAVMLDGFGGKVVLKGDATGRVYAEMGPGVPFSLYE